MPDRMSGLIRIQTVWHTDGTPESTFFKKLILKKNSDEEKNREKIPAVTS